MNNKENNRKKPSKTKTTTTAAKRSMPDTSDDELEVLKDISSSINRSNLNRAVCR